MSLKQSVDELNNMVKQFQILEAFDKFYADDVVMQENTEKPRVGKTINREFELQGLESTAELHAAEVKGVAVNEDDQIAMTEWFIDFTFKDGRRETRNQVAVQKWNNGKIVNERFYYTPT